MKELIFLIVLAALAQPLFRLIKNKVVFNRCIVTHSGAIDKKSEFVTEISKRWIISFSLLFTYTYVFNYENFTLQIIAIFALVLFLAACIGAYFKL